MSEASRDLGASAEHDKIGPDYFGFYACEVAELISQDVDFLPFASQNSDLAEETLGIIRDECTSKHKDNGKEANSLNGCSSSSLFSNGFGATLSEFKKERMRAVLHQSVFALTKEVDEMLDPVLHAGQIQSLLRYKKSPPCSATPFKDDAERHPCKKLKPSSSSSSISIPLHATPINGRVSEEDSGSEEVFLENGIHNDINKHCSPHHSSETSKSKQAGHKSLSDVHGSKLEEEKKTFSSTDQKKESCLDSTLGSEKEFGDVDDELLFFMEKDSLMVEEYMKKHSDELLATLCHMEQKLEEIHEAAMSTCRLMTRAEKRQLWKLIQNLPPRNLDRVAEIVRRRKPPGSSTLDEIDVDLEEEDNKTLWRLYYYVQTVDNATKLPL